MKALSDDLFPPGCSRCASRCARTIYIYLSIYLKGSSNFDGLTGNFDECVRNDTDDTDVCVSLIVMPGIWASEYALPLLSFNGDGGILYGGLGIFVSTTTTATIGVLIANFVDAALVKDVDDGDDGGDGGDDWLFDGLLVFAGVIDSLPADKKIDNNNKKRDENKITHIILHSLVLNSSNVHPDQISTDQW